VIIGLCIEKGVDIHAQPWEELPGKGLCSFPDDDIGARVPALLWGLTWPP
jgi:hypothetical protein